MKIIREGKEHGQGVGYLDDGTMIIVDNAQKMLNMNVEVVVTSVSADNSRPNDFLGIERSGGEEKSAESPKSLELQNLIF